MGGGAGPGPQEGRGRFLPLTCSLAQQGHPSLLSLPAFSSQASPEPPAPLFTASLSPLGPGTSTASVGEEFAA